VEGCEEPLVALGCLLASFVFSLLEGGLLYYLLVRLEGRLGAQATRIDRHRHELLRSCRLLNHIFNVVFVVVVAEYLSGVKGLEGVYKFVAVVGISVGGVIVVGEILPLAVGRLWPEWAVWALRDFAFAARALMWPLTKSLTKAGTLFLRVRGRRSRGEEAEQRVLDAALESAKRGLLGTDEVGMIEGVVSLHSRTAAQIMTPRTDIVALEAEATVKDALTVFQKCGHSRLPVYKETLDEIVGVLYAKDLLFYLAQGNSGEKRVSELVRKPLFVPETKSVFALLRQMRSERTHIAIVVDEYGGTSGLVTFEDVVEEVVGEIEDEFERAKAEKIKPVGEGVFIVDGRTPLEEIAERIGVNLNRKIGVETIGGLVVLKLGRIPKPGERVRANGLSIEVVEADARRVRRVRLRK